MLAFFGVILLIIVVKFLYDNFATNNAANDWEWYKSNFPEEAHRLDNNKGLDMRVKPKNDFARKQLSLIELSKNLGTTPELARDMYLLQLSELVDTLEERDYLLKDLRSKKILEAKMKSIDPDDGVAAIMHDWSVQYFESEAFKIKIAKYTNDMKKQETKNMIDKEDVNYASNRIFIEFPEVKRLVDAGDREALIKYLQANPEASNLWMNYLNK
jgi:hypothetical protein